MFSKPPLLPCCREQSLTLFLSLQIVPADGFISVSIDFKLAFVRKNSSFESKTFKREVRHMEYFAGLFFKLCPVNSWLATEISTAVHESTLSRQMFILKWTSSSLIALNSSCRIKLSLSRQSHWKFKISLSLSLVNFYRLNYEQNKQPSLWPDSPKFNASNVHFDRSR